MHPHLADREPMHLALAVRGGDPLEGDGRKEHAVLMAPHHVNLHAHAPALDLDMTSQTSWTTISGQRGGQRVDQECVVLLGLDRQGPRWQPPLRLELLTAIGSKDLNDSTMIVKDMHVLMVCAVPTCPWCP